MKKSLLYLICCFICFSAFSQASDLKFRDGKFKIVQLTDLHWVESDSYYGHENEVYNSMMSFCNVND